MSEAKLSAKVVEIDLRDGQADNKMTAKPKRCPKCEAMLSPKRAMPVLRPSRRIAGFVFVNPADPAVGFSSPALTGRTLTPRPPTGHTPIDNYG